MTGKIIAFRSYRGRRRASPYCQEAVPRGRDRQAQLRLHVLRISALLQELESLKHVGESLPSPLAAQARATIDKARSVVSAEPERVDDSDPQPDVDRALLERMYRDLNPYT